VPFIFKCDGDAIAVEGPERFLEAVIEFTVPLAAEESFDLAATVEKFGAIAPHRVFCIAQNDLLWVAGIPEIFRVLDFQQGRFFREWWSNFLCHFLYPSNWASRPIEACRSGRPCWMTGDTAWIQGSPVKAGSASIFRGLRDCNIWGVDSPDYENIYSERNTGFGGCGDSGGDDAVGYAGGELGAITDV